MCLLCVLFDSALFVVPKQDGKRNQVTNLYSAAVNLHALPFHFLSICIISKKLHDLALVKKMMLRDLSCTNGSTLKNNTGFRLHMD